MTSCTHCVEISINSEYFAEQSVVSNYVHVNNYWFSLDNIDGYRKKYNNEFEKEAIQNAVKWKKNLKKEFCLC